MLRFMFCCSMRGRHDNVSVEVLREIVRYLASLMPNNFELITDHQVAEGAIEADNNEPNIYLRENERLDTCNFVICEISDPSGGVGGQAVYAEQKRIPLLLLAHEQVPEEQVSKYLRDMANLRSEESAVVRYETYRDPHHVSQIVREFGWSVLGLSR